VVKGYGMGGRASYYCLLEFPGAFAGHYVAVGGHCADLDGAWDSLGRGVRRAGRRAGVVVLHLRSRWVDRSGWFVCSC
jgi:hypothetical protein